MEMETVRAKEMVMAKEMETGKARVMETVRAKEMVMEMVKE
jgi:hypothetical protein